MLNQIILVGRLTKDIEVIKSKEKTYSRIFLAIPRSFKNINGEYETDFIECVLFDGIAKSTSEYCHKGDIVGVKGRLQSNQYEDETGKKHYGMEVIAERVTFLSSKPKEEENEVKKDSKNKKKADE